MAKTPRSIPDNVPDTSPQPDPAMRSDSLDAPLDATPVLPVAPSPADLPDPSPRLPRSPAMNMPGAVQAADGSVSYVVGQPALLEGTDQPRTATAEDAVVPGTPSTVEVAGSYVHIKCGQRTAPQPEHPQLDNGAWCRWCRNYYGLAEFTGLSAPDAG